MNIFNINELILCIVLVIYCRICYNDLCVWYIDWFISCTLVKHSMCMCLMLVSGIKHNNIIKRRII